MGRFWSRVSGSGFVAGIALLATVLTGCGPLVTVQVSPLAPLDAVSPTKLVVGVTHTQLDVDTTQAPDDIATERAILSAIPVQNQHLMGWGALNPEPSPGTYDWSSLDNRIAMITSTGAEPVLTLCCAPDWMKGGVAGATDWNNLTIAPTPQHVADFAALAAKAAARYPQVHRFQVWNELKGYYDGATNNWDVVGYTNLYNAVYDAVKAVRPDAAVGGPYAPLEIWSDPVTMSNPSQVRGPWGIVDQRALDVITYWLAHAHGADFISLDGWTSTRDKGFVTDPFTASELFTTMTQWVRARTDLPIWWSELHVTDPAWNQSKQDAVSTVAVARLATSGASLAFFWQPQALGSTCRSCLWTDPALGTVWPTPLSASIAAWDRCAPPGASWRAATASDPDDVFVAATDHGTIVVNKSEGPITIGFGDQQVPAGPFAVRAIPGDGTCHG